jgi:hypothetical protein
LHWPFKKARAGSSSSPYRWRNWFLLTFWVSDCLSQAAVDLIFWFQAPWSCRDFTNYISHQWSSNSAVSGSHLESFKSYWCPGCTPGVLNSLAWVWPGPEESQNLHKPVLVGSLGWERLHYNALDLAVYFTFLAHHTKAFSTHILLTYFQHFPLE